MKKITQEDIAKKLKITRTTVARALNGNGYVEEKLKNLIIQTADEMGYRTNLVARSLAKKGGWNIYCFLVSYNYEFAQQLESGLRAAEREFQHFGFVLHVVRHHPDNPEIQVEDLRKVLKMNTVDGLIISPMLTTEVDAVIECCAEKNLPISSINVRFYNKRNLFYVGSNPMELGALAAELLSKLIGGKGKIVVFNAFSQFEVLYLRFRGFVSEIKKNSQIQIVEYCYLENIEDSYDSAKAALGKYNDLDGMYTNTEVTHLSRALKDSGRQDVKLVGNDLNDEIKTLIHDSFIDIALHDRPYLQGYLSGKYMFNFLLNHILPKQEITYVGFDIATKNNLNVDETFKILTNS